MSDILVSIVCLAVVAAACVLGIYSRHYREDWAQYVGLVLVLLWSVGRGSDLTMRWLDWMGGALVPRPDMSTQQLLGHVGLALFAIGTARKVWRHARAAP